MSNKLQILLIWSFITILSLFQMRYREYITLMSQEVPTATEVLIAVQRQYPNLDLHCSLVQRTVGEENIIWGSHLTFEADFLECPELGISTRVKVE